MSTTQELLAANERYERLRAAVEGLAETCREWPDTEPDRCNAPAEFILWGMLFPSDALGPRCYDHAVRHTSHHMPSNVAQWAVFDLRQLARLDSA